MKINGFVDIIQKQGTVCCKCTIKDPPTDTELHTHTDVKHKLPTVTTIWRKIAATAVQ